MTMLLFCALFSPALASDGVVDTGTDACTEANGHPETGGFYIRGFGYKDIEAHNDPDDPSTYGEEGQKADDTLWTKNPAKPYPDGMPKACTPSMWTDCSSFLDRFSFLTPHTCSIVRFSYPADSSSTVYKMQSNTSFQMCDFTGAVLITEGGTLASGAKYVDYPFDYDSMNDQYFFASLDGCEDGQKVAIMPFSEYTSTYDQCYSMGTTSSRVQHCDCDHSIRPTTLNEICLTGFVDGCMSQMPADTSCCPGDDASSPSFGTYLNGGNCIRKNQKDDMMEFAKEIHDKCTGDATKADCDVYLKGDCPWEKKSQGYYAPAILNTADDEIDGAATVFDPHCDPWYMISHCADLEAGKTVGEGFTVNTTKQITEDITKDSCGQSLHVAAYKMYVEEKKAGATTAAPSAAATAPTAAATTAAPALEAESFAALAALGLTLALRV
jgi:hypothetical protein